jgi:hypothetical protein
MLSTGSIRLPARVSRHSLLFVASKAGTQPLALDSRFPRQQAEFGFAGRSISRKSRHEPLSVGNSMRPGAFCERAPAAPRVS